MKKTTILLLLCLTTVLFAGKIPRQTGDYYRAYIDKFVNKSVSLRVKYFDMDHYISSTISKLKGYRPCYAWTAYKDDNGGSMLIYLPTDKYGETIKKYGTTYQYVNGNYRTKLLKGTLKVDGKRLYMVVGEPAKSSSEEKPKVVENKVASRTEISELVKNYNKLSVSNRKKIQFEIKLALSAQK